MIFVHDTPSSAHFVHLHGPLAEAVIRDRSLGSFSYVDGAMVYVPPEGEREQAPAAPRRAALVDWTRATLTTVLETARNATPGPWEGVVDDHGRGNVEASVWSDEIGYYITETITSGDRHREDAAHIGLNDPRVTVARCEAELAILDDHPCTRSSAGPCRTVRLIAWGHRHDALGYPGPEEKP